MCEWEKKTAYVRKSLTSIFLISSGKNSGIFHSFWKSWNKCAKATFFKSLFRINGFLKNILISGTFSSSFDVVSQLLKTKIVNFYYQIVNFWANEHRHIKNQWLHSRLDQVANCNLQVLLFATVTSFFFTFGISKYASLIHRRLNSSSPLLFIFIIRTVNNQWLTMVFPYRKI